MEDPLIPKTPCTWFYGLLRPLGGCPLRDLTMKLRFLKSSLNFAKSSAQQKFWDYRPFTRVVKAYKALLHLRDYIQINVLEGLGCSKPQARLIWAQRDTMIKSED
jgi:hypothetical protein